LQARRLDIFFAEKFRAFLDRFEDGHAARLNFWRAVRQPVCQRNWINVFTNSQFSCICSS
jgi:hypothetical protein